MPLRTDERKTTCHGLLALCLTLAMLPVKGFMMSLLFARAHCMQRPLVLSAAQLHQACILRQGVNVMWRIHAHRSLQAGGFDYAADLSDNMCMLCAYALMLIAGRCAVELWFAPAVSCTVALQFRLMSNLRMQNMQHQVGPGPEVNGTASESYIEYVYAVTLSSMVLDR